MRPFFEDLVTEHWFKELRMLNSYVYSVNSAENSTDLNNIPTPAERFWKSLVWDKLSNSGELLKLLVPSYSQKAISG